MFTVQEAARAVPLPGMRSFVDRFWTFTDQSDSCWIWTGAIYSPPGYGRLSFQRGRSATNFLAHRVAYELLVGPIPDGLVLDHLCRVRHCVNPDHLEPVTERVNILRGTSFGAENAAKTHCIHGHPFDAANTKIHRRVGKPSTRYCVTCHRERDRRRIRRRGQPVAA